MLRMFDNLSDRNKGIVSIIAGVVLLLFTFGFMHKLLTFVIIAGGVFLIALGCYKLQVHKKVQDLLEKKK